MTVPEKQGVTDWILKGHTKKFIAGPFDLNYKFPFGNLVLAPIFVVPKPNGTYRPVVHLSHRKYPFLYSVNDLLCEYMKTVQYIRFREVVNLVNNAGLGAFLFLIDAKDAYYRVPIASKDWKYMGLKWAEKLWVFRSLQMGCSSSPRIYTIFADAVEYICVKKDKKNSFYNGMQQLRHYIDDFFAACPTQKGAWELFRNVFNTFEELGIPTNVDKCKYPWTKREILGWLYNTILRVVGLPENKRLILLEMIEKLLKNKKSDKKFLEQLTGRLQNTSLVVYPGKAFVRRIEAVLHLPKWRYDEPIPLSHFVLEDLKWWKNILSKPELCCTSFDLILKRPFDGDFHLYSDATSTVGGGGFVMDNRNNIVWSYQFEWSDTILYEVKKYRKIEIDVLELILSLTGIILLLPQLKNKCVTIYNDNPAAAAAIRTKAPRLYRLDLQFLVRYLATLAVEHKFYFWGIHEIVKESKNMQLADDLSRFQASARIKTKNAPRKWPLKIVNDLLLQLLEQPANLKPSIEIGNSRRKVYGLLLNDYDGAHTIPSVQDYLDSQHLYNVLK